MRHLATAQNFHPSLATTISFPPRHWRTNVFFTSFPLSFILTLPLPGISFLPFPDICKNDVEEKRERQRGTRKADEWRDILLKTKRRGWNKYASVRSSPLPLLFFICFYFLFFSPLFFVSRRDRSTSVSFCSPLFFFIYLPFFLQPPPNERRKNDNILLPSRRFSPPEPLDSPACFVCILIDPRLREHFGRFQQHCPSFHSTSMLLASWMYPNTCNQLEYHRWKLWPCDFSSFPPPVHMIACSFLSSPRLFFHVRFRRRTVGELHVLLCCRGETEIQLFWQLAREWIKI